MTLPEVPKRVIGQKRMSFLNPLQSNNFEFKRRGTEDLIYEEQLQNDNLDEKERALMNLLKENFKVFCTYRFYNSHSKAMTLRRDEIRKNLINRVNKQGDRRQYQLKDYDYFDEIKEENQLPESDQVFMDRETLKFY